MPDIEFFGQSVTLQAAPGANSARLINCYREAVPVGGVTRFMIRPVLGQVEIAALGVVQLRAMEWVDGSIYIAAGGALYRMTEAGVATNLGAIRDSVDTTISGNIGVVTVAAGGKFYVWDGSTLSQPTGAAFSDFGSVELLSNYTLLTQRGGRQFQWSAIGDATDLDALDFATTEARSDNNIRGVALAGLYWIFKERSIEIWYPTGVDASAFERVSSGVIDTGLKAFGLLTKARDALFFVGSDGLVYVTTGQGVQPVSTRVVEESIRLFDATHCHYHEADGHKFCVIRFSNRPAWVFDIATGEWHERSEGRLHKSWDVVATVKGTSGQWFAGGSLGKFISLSRVQTDFGGEMYRRMISRTLRSDGQRFRVPEFEIFGAYGHNDAIAPSYFYLELGDGYVGPEDGGYLDLGMSGELEPFMMVSTSSDSGATWSAPRQADMGSQGEYEQRAVLRSLGQFRQFTARIDITHRHEMPIYSDARIRIA